MQTKIPHFWISAFAFLSISHLLFSKPTKSSPFTRLLVTACSSNNAINVNAFYYNRNLTFADIRSKLNTSHFATAANAHISDPVYALFQCRNYLSRSDCLACFDVSSEQIRNCSTACGARVIYDGCFLRYEINNFYDHSTQAGGNSGLCENRTASMVAGFNQEAEKLLSDLSIATPKIAGYWAAVRREGTGGAVVHGVAQCALTVSESGCSACLRVAYSNINSCPPYDEGVTIDAGCFLRYSTAAFFGLDQTVDIEPHLKGSWRKKKAIAAGAGGVAFLLVLSLLFALFLKPSKRSEQGEVIAMTEQHGQMNFHYQELKSATKNFSQESKLGEGGFGAVYLGVLRNSEKVAVKKLSIKKPTNTLAEFENEVKLIINVCHRNLIQLLGFCREGPEYLLVYEYMANGSLDKYLFGDSRGTLNWRQRFDIIVGIARGLAYLHEELHVCIIHRDIKSNNILLDEEFQPKIADFGLARLFPADQTHLTTRSAGTLGYMAPEYAVLGKLSEKVDVYSYGVVVLEITSGRKSTDIKLEPITEYLLNWAWRLYEEESLMELVDENLDLNEYEVDEVKDVMKIGLMCTQSVSSRPAMSEVLARLQDRDKLGLKLRPPFLVNATNK